MEENEEAVTLPTASPPLAVTTAELASLPAALASATSAVPSAFVAFVAGAAAAVGAFLRLEDVALLEAEAAAVVSRVTAALGLERERVWTIVGSFCLEWTV